MKFLSILLIAFSLPFSLFGQVPEKFPPSMTPKGAYGIMDPFSIDQMMEELPGFGGSAREMLQQQSIKPYLMPVRKAPSKSEESAYLVSTCLEYYVNRENNFKANLSPDFITINLRKSASQRLSDVLSVLIERGTVSAAVVPYQSTTISDAAFSVQSYKIVNFLHIFRELSPARQSIFEVKKALLRGHPILVEVKADQDFRAATGTKNVSPGAPDEIQSLLVVGFDESLGAFEVLTCRGYEWGQNGYAFMRYDEFEKAALNGYVLVTE
jgi:hypothetical protein